MNFYEYIQNTNIEVAIVMNPKSNASKIANVAVSTENLEESSKNYLGEIIENSNAIYRKTQQYESGFLEIAL